jgi:hypothetical protein
MSNQDNHKNHRKSHRCAFFDGHKADFDGFDVVIHVALTPALTAL